ncbi:MAG: hypothetical protein B5M53_10135 [Candidatus Cloacimonas sp. 4484_209]|nr:MAG: hypothetical protein B5M53_10135 [Candidatus Cloacimonas sp. 4484_209]
MKTNRTKEAILTKEDKDSHLDIIAYLKVLWRRKIVMTTAVGATLFFTLIYTFISPKIYEAQTSILIQQIPEGKDTFLTPWEYIGARENFINNQAQILKSRTNLKLVIDKIRKEHSGENLPILKDPDPITSLAYNIIVKPVERTDIVNILVHSTDPKEAAIIANTVAENLLEQSRLTARSAVSEVRKFLEKQLKIVQNNLKESADSLRVFKEKNRVFSLSNEGEELFTKLSTFDSKYNEIEADYITKKKQLDFLKKKYEQNQKNLVTDITEIKSPLIMNLRKKLISLETEYSNYLLQGLPENHPKMEKIKSLINETKRSLQKEVRKYISSGAENGNLITENQKITKLAQLERAYKINDNTYEMLMQKYEEAKITEAGQLGSVKIIDKAFIPTFAIKPNKKKNLLFAILVGIGIGLVFTVFTEYIDTSIKEPKEVEEYIGEPTLGIIPNINHTFLSKEKNNGKLGNAKKLLLTEFPPRSGVAEAYRSLRTNLQYFNTDKPIKSILITSSIAQEGKSTIVSNLAISLSQLGLKTVMVDADLRKPMLHKLFEADLSPGLTNLIISKDVEFKKTIKNTRIENLFLITAGSVPPNPAELLESKRMKEVSYEITKEFDYLIFDAPPIVLVADAVILSTLVDGVILIIEAKKTRRDAIFSSKEIIKNVGGKILGTVLNKTRFSRMDYMYGGYSGYYYYGYDESGHKTKKKKQKGGKRNEL